MTAMHMAILCLCLLIIVLGVGYLASALIYLSLVFCLDKNLVLITDETDMNSLPQVATELLGA